MKYTQILGGDSVRRANKDKQINKGISKRLKYCKGCKMVWEKDYTLGHPILYYEDFPTIGLERIICSKCKSE